MLVKIHNGKPTATASTTNETADAMFLANNPSYIKTSFKFELPLFCYEYIDGTFQLVTDWEQLKMDAEQEQEGNIRNEEDKYVPQVLSARQARLALHRSGKLADVATVIDNLTEPMKS